MKRSVLCLLLSAFCLPLLAQVNESVTVSVTNVDVVVTDFHGKRIRGLTKDEFEVFEDGKKREITNFAEYARSVAATASAAGSAPGIPAAEAAAATPEEPLPRRIMILVDNATLTMPNRKTFVAGAHAFVDDNVRPGDRVMIVTTSMSLMPRLGWTTDRAAVHHLLDSINDEVTVGNREMERRRVESQIHDAMTGDAIQARGSRMTFDDLVWLVRNYSANQQNQARQTLSSFAAALNFFPRTAERKILVIAGEGVPLHPGEDMWQYLDTLRSSSDQMSPGLRRGARSASPVNESFQYDIGREIRGLTSAAYKRGIVIYPLNPGMNEELEVENRRAPDRSAQFAKVAANMASYQLMARDTGGMAFIGARPNIAFAAVARDLDAYYSLGFRSSEKRGTIVVKSKQGYSVRTILFNAQQPLEELVTDTVLANHVTTPETNDLAIALAADPAVADADKLRLPLKVLIPVRNLKFIKQGGEVLGAFEVYVSTGDAQGNASSVSKQAHELRWPADALPHLQEKNVTFALEVVLEPGRDQVSVGVVDPRTEKTGYARIAVK